MAAIIIAACVIGFFLLHSGVFDRYGESEERLAHVLKTEPEKHDHYYTKRGSSADRTSYRVYLFYFSPQEGDYVDAKSDRLYPEGKWIKGDELVVRPLKKDPHTVHIIRGAWEE